MKEWRACEPTTAGSRAAASPGINLIRTNKYFLGVTPDLEVREEGKAWAAEWRVSGI